MNIKQNESMKVLEYVMSTMPTYEPQPHHEIICDALDKVAEGEISNLIINMPPRHGKSELASVRFPSYYLGRFPDREIIFATSAEKLAIDFAGKVEDVVRSPKHGLLCPQFSLKSARQRRVDWKTDQGGSYFATGVGGPITGRGANLIIVDDAIKGNEEADSPAARNKLWDWYNTVLSTRRTNTRLPKGHKAAIVVIQTKWHEDDLSGRLTQEMEAGGEQWEVIDIPALTIDGRIPTKSDYENRKDELQPLWPDRYDLDYLMNTRGRDNEKQRSFNCLYQQQPVPDDGMYFDKGWFEFSNANSSDLTIYGCSDYAFQLGNRDQTWHLIVGVDRDFNFHILDGYHGQEDMLTCIDKQLDLVNIYRPVLWISEAGPTKRASESYAKKRMVERGIYFTAKYIIKGPKKTVEARPLQAVAADKRIFLPNNELGEQLLEQLVKFPAGREDDGVDALTNLFLGIDKLNRGSSEEDKPSAKPDRWDRAFARQEELIDDWMII